jgi:SPX domain protein involved in polyphosphate accumulation
MNIIDVSRYEFKYLLNSEQVPEVRRFLLQYCSPDVNAHGEEWYGIHSLYLDTPEYAFYHASVEKAVERLKLRVRGYATAAGPVKLEIKRRVGDVVFKRSLITSHEVCGDLNRRGVWCLAETNRASLPFVGLVEQMRAAPRVLVTYERHALYSNVDDYVRVTFDRRMMCQRMPEWSLRGDPRGWLCVDDPASACEQYSTYVLELKFKVSPPAWLRDMVRTFGLVRRGFSKYGRSVTRLSIGRDPAWDLRSHTVVPARAWRVA